MLTPTRHRQVKWRAGTSDVIATVWGLAEATFFFIIPDMYISYRSLRSFRQGVQACGYALLGALAGGTILYVAASHNPASTLSFVNHVPTVTQHTITNVQHEYQIHGTIAVLYGPLQTSPYKVYAALAPVFAIGYVPFIVISVLARLARFVAVAAATSVISRALKSRIGLRARIGILTSCWVLVYGIFLYTHWI